MTTIVGGKGTFKVNVETFDRREASKEEQSKAVRLVNNTNFETFNRAECREYIQTNGALIARSDGIIDGTGRKQAFKLETALVERGLFESAKEFNRIPGMLASRLNDGEAASYTVVRLIYPERLDREQVLLSFDDETALLERYQDTLYFMMPWRGLQNGIVMQWQRVIFSPERFLRISTKLEQHYAIEQVAREILLPTLSRNSAELVLQYAGYPTESEKAQAETQRAGLQKEATSPACFSLPDPQAEQTAPPESNTPSPGLFTRLKNWWNSKS